MDKVSIGIYEKALPASESWDYKFETAKQAGYDFIEIAIDETDVRLARLTWTQEQLLAFHKSALSAGVQLNSIVLSAHRRFPMGSANLETRQRSVEILRQAVDFAVATGFRMIQLAGYYVFYEEHSPDNYKYFCEGLSQAVEYASHFGVILALENVDGEDILSIEKIMHFVEIFNNPFLQVYPDVGNLAGNGFDIATELRKAEGHLVGIHLKDAKVNVFRRIAFGEGLVNFSHVFQTLAQMNYSGNFLIEMWNDNSPNSMDIVTDARLWIIEQMKSGGLITQ